MTARHFLLYDVGLYNNRKVYFINPKIVHISDYFRFKELKFSVQKIWLPQMIILNFLSVATEFSEELKFNNTNQIVCRMR